MKYLTESRRDSSGRLVYLWIKPPRGKKIELKFDYRWEDGLLKCVDIEGLLKDLPTISEIMRMILGSPSLYPSLAVSRPQWYDRNPSSKNDMWTGDNLSAPQSPSPAKMTYTCPNTKKAMVELLQCNVRRASAATTVGDAGSYITLTSYGGAERTILEARILNNTVDAKENVSLGTTLTLYPGDVLNFRIWDNSTGGSCDYHLFYKLTEFDA